MLKKLVWLSVGCFFALGVNAQHEEKVQMKIDQIQNLMVTVESSALEEVQKTWALESLTASLNTLENHQSEADIDKLKLAEVEINKINQLVVEAMIEAQRLKLIAKIKEIDALIVKYAWEGMNTEK